MNDQNEPQDVVDGEQTYYEQNREARKAYQLRYYQRVKERLARKREVARHLDEEGKAEYDRYQAEYYAKNKARLLEQRRIKYAERRKAAGKVYKPRTKQSQ